MLQNVMQQKLQFKQLWMGIGLELLWLSQAMTKRWSCNSCFFFFQCLLNYWPKGGKNYQYIGNDFLWLISNQSTRQQEWNWHSYRTLSRWCICRRKSMAIIDCSYCKNLLSRSERHDLKQMGSKLLKTKMLGWSFWTFKRRMLQPNKSQKLLSQLVML